MEREIEQEIIGTVTSQKAQEAIGNAMVTIVNNEEYYHEGQIASIKENKEMYDTLPSSFQEICDVLYAIGQDHQKRLGEEKAVADKRIKNDKERQNNIHILNEKYPHIRETVKKREMKSMMHAAITAVAILTILLIGITQSGNSNNKKSTIPKTEQK